MSAGVWTFGTKSDPKTRKSPKHGIDVLSCDFGDFRRKKRENPNENIDVNFYFFFHSVLAANDMYFVSDLFHCTNFDAFDINTHSTIFVPLSFVKTHKYACKIYFVT